MTAGATMIRHWTTVAILTVLGAVTHAVAQEIERKDPVPVPELKAVPPPRLATRPASSAKRYPVPKVAQRRAGFGSSRPIDDATWQLMQGRSWKPNMGCPKREELALLTIPFTDLAGQEQLGEMVVAKTVVADVLKVFADLYRVKFPIASIRLIDRFEGDDGASMAANNTSAFNCRRVTGGLRLSEHAFGTAIDINPVQNPYVVGGRARPPAGQRFAKLQARLAAEPGLVTADDAAVTAFSRVGWKWGGAWLSIKDYQHFSKSGR